MNSETNNTEAATDPAGRIDELVTHEFSQGVCGDGAAILKDGQPITVDEVIQLLNTAEHVKSEIKYIADFSLGFALCNKEHGGTQRDVKKAIAKLNELLDV